MSSDSLQIFTKNQSYYNIRKSKILGLKSKQLPRLRVLMNGHFSLILPTTSFDLNAPPQTKKSIYSFLFKVSTSNLTQGVMRGQESHFWHQIAHWVTQKPICNPFYYEHLYFFSPQNLLYTNLNISGGPPFRNLKFEICLGKI